MASLAPSYRHSGLPGNERPRKKPAICWLLEAGTREGMRLTPSLSSRTRSGAEGTLGLDFSSTVKSWATRKSGPEETQVLAMDCSRGPGLRQRQPLSIPSALPSPWGPWPESLEAGKAKESKGEGHCLRPKGANFLTTPRPSGDNLAPETWGQHSAQSGFSQAAPHPARHRHGWLSEHGPGEAVAGPGRLVSTLQASGARKLPPRTPVSPAQSPLSLSSTKDTICDFGARLASASWGQAMMGSLALASHSRETLAPPPCFSTATKNTLAKSVLLPGQTRCPWAQS